MKLSHVKDTITATYLSGIRNVVYMLWGSPGVGKSSVVKQAAMAVRDALNEKAHKQPTIKGAVMKDEPFGFIDLRLALMEPIDIRGLPKFIGDKEVRWIAPSFLPKGGRGILFIDELVQASPSTQAAASQLILDRKIGEYVLPEGWIVVAAGNKKSDRASTNEMPTHMKNRFVHIHVEVSVDEWIAWALANDIDIRCIAYVKWRPTKLHAFDATARVEAFATPRSWEFVSNLLKANVPAEALADLIKGAIGEEIGTEFVSFLRVYERMPSIDVILLNPTQAPIVTDPATLYAVAQALVHKATRDNLAKIITYFGRIKDAGRPDFAVVAHKELSLQKPELTNTKSYIAWTSDLAPLIS